MAKAQKSGSPGFETSLKRLEEIVGQLEEGEIPLERALSMYEEGIGCARACAELLGDAEMKLKRLGRDLDGTLRLFDQENEKEE
jgi:exodeoxyribonuclease VII small subunit